jgi:hypothetical protein
MLLIPHYSVIENQSLLTNELRNAMVLPYDFLIFVIFLEGIRKLMHLSFLVRTEKVQRVGSSLFLKETTRTHSLSKKNQYPNHDT